MPVVEVGSVLLLDREAVRVVVSRLDRVLRDAWYPIIPWSVDLIDAMP